MHPADLDLLAMLKRVRLPTVANVLPRMIERAAAESWSHRDFLAAIIGEEVAHRETTRIQRSASLAKFPYLKTIEEFDFIFQSSIKRSQLGLFLDPDFVANGRHLILEGRPGLGKTHLAIATHSQELGPRLVSDGAQIDDILSFIEFQQASKQRVDLAEGVLRGQRSNAVAGFSSGGKAPYGFVRAVLDQRTKAVTPIASDLSLRGGKTKGKFVVIVPGTSDEDVKKLAVVKYIHEEYARGILGMYGIATELNRRGVASPFAGRERHYRDGEVRPVPGAWTVNSVRGVLEQPLYAGKLAWGRRNYGSIRRADHATATGYRKVRNEERTSTNQRKARAHEHRDYRDWLMVDPAVPFDPIVPLGVWQSNMDRLRERGSIGQQLGRPKCADGNKFPLHITCGDCGARMAGHYQGGSLVFKCSTYLNSAGTKCHPNWVPRDPVVVFAVEAMRRWVQVRKHRKALEAEVRRILEANEAQRSEKEARLAALKDEVEEGKRLADRAYRDYAKARSAEEEATTRKLYDESHDAVQKAKAEASRLEGELVSLGVIDEDEMAATIAFLDRFERTLAHLPEDRLRRTFEAMGVRLHVNFTQNPGKGRRKRIPVGGTLTFGANSAGLATVVEATPESTSPSAGAEGDVPNDKHWRG